MSKRYYIPKPALQAQAEDANSRLYPRCPACEGRLGKALVCKQCNREYAVVGEEEAKEG